NAATDVPETITIVKAGERIAFAALKTRAFGGPSFRVRASASSGLPVSFQAAGKCALRGSLVRLTGAGRCSVTASQAGDANYNSAASVKRSFAVMCRV